MKNAQIADLILKNFCKKINEINLNLKNTYSFLNFFCF